MPELLQHIRGAGLLIAPEIILLVGVCVLFFVGSLLVTDAGEAPTGLRRGWGLFSLITLAIAAVAWWQIGLQPAEHGLFQSDALLWYVRGLAFVGGGLLALVLWNQIDDGHSSEAYACLLSIVAGTSLVAAANDLVTLFLALELVSIPTYVILYLGRRDRIGGEATLKYFLLSIFSSALVLYGMSWVYGVAGSTNFGAIRLALDRAPHAGEGMLEIAFALLVAGLCFRIAAVPFHFYAPDVFQGTTASNAALLSLIPKIVGFVALMRVIPLSGAASGGPQWIPEADTKQLLAVIAVVTMFVGNLMALRQKHLFRLMAYSSIAHAGYMLIGLAIGDILPVGGRQAILFYLATYGLVTIGVFALFIAGGDGERALQTDDDVRGLSRSKPIVALMLAICLFSLTGLPPTAGFLGKLYLFFAAWGDDSHIGHGLAICLAINAAISAYYYLRLVALMFLEPATKPALPRAEVAWASWLAGVACAIATIALFITPQWLWDSIH